MVQLGLCSVTFRNKTCEEIIDISKESGLNFIEWGSDVHVLAGDFDRAREIRDLCKKNNISLSYGSYFKYKDKDDFGLVLETAQNLGAKNIRVWAKRIASKDFSEVEYQRLVTDTQKYADLAAEYDINICFENHRKTYTDTTTSAKKLLYDVSRDNVFMYWQPQAGESINERLDAIKTLKNKLKTIHVFNWDDEFNRYPLKDAKEEWKIYANELGCDRPYLLEFVINDDINQFREDVKTLKEIIGG